MNKIISAAALNEISVDTDIAQGIEADTSHIPMRLTLPSGECRLSFTVQVNDGTLPAGKEVAVSFIDKNTHRGMTGLGIVRDGKNQWGYTSIQPVSAAGKVSFALRVPVPLPDNLALRAVLEGDLPPVEGKNMLTFILTEHVTDNSRQVDRLEKVSGDGQWVQLSDTRPFGNLVVRALHNNAPVESASVTWSVTGDPAHTGVTVPSAPVFSDAGGLASVLPVAGHKKGRLTVTATCNGQSVSFNLTILPARADLALIPGKLPAVQPVIATQHQTARVRLITRGNDNEFWPGIPCRFHQATALTPGMVVANTPVSDTSVVSDLQGWLPPFLVCFSKAPPRGTRGEVTFQACLPGNDTSPAAVTVTLNVAS